MFEVVGHSNGQVAIFGLGRLAARGLVLIWL